MHSFQSLLQESEFSEKHPQLCLKSTGALCLLKEEKFCSFYDEAIGLMPLGWTEYLFWLPWEWVI